MVAQLVRALACHARGRGFEPHPSRHFLKNTAARTEEVVNDSPVDCQSRRRPRRAVRAATDPHPSRHFLILADLAHLVERHLAKVEVAGSSPVIRSKQKQTVWSAFLFFRGAIRGVHTPRVLGTLRVLYS